MAMFDVTESRSEAQAAQGDPEGWARVWDPFVRIFHWGLVASVGFALLSGLWLRADWIAWHLVAGTVALLLVVLRIVWGFTGTRHARFADFAFGPRWTLTHLRHMLRGGGGRYLGHNPLGAWMVFALILSVLALGMTGVTALGGILRTGPLARLDYGLGVVALRAHLLLGWGVLALIGLHVAGALFESLRERENLVRAMITGRKKRRKGDRIFRGHIARPALATGLGAATTALILAAGLGLRPAPARPPIARLDPAFVAECSECHDAYHPSLLDAESWRALMASLDDHFGEDASLDPDTAQRITAFLAANAAETADTRAAHEISRTDPTAPFTPSRSPFWIRTHSSLPDQIFKGPPVYGRFNCSACHKDAATGWFSPARIEIPQSKDNAR